MGDSLACARSLEKKPIDRKKKRVSRGRMNEE